MSVPADVLEWVGIANDDFGLAMLLVRQRRYPALACFHAQQAAEKYIKAVLTAIGTVLLLDNLGWLAIEEWELVWPLFVIAVGVALVAGGLRSRRRRTAVAAGATAGDDPVFHAAAVMGGVRRQITSREFIGGDVSAVMGGCEIDLRHAEMAGDTAEIEVFALWGGIDLAVPDHWRIEIRGLPVMGAFEDTTRPRTADAGRLLIIRGMALMGGIEIKSDLGKNS